MQTLTTAEAISLQTNNSRLTRLLGESDAVVFGLIRLLPVDFFHVHEAMGRHRERQHTTIHERGRVLELTV